MIGDFFMQCQYCVAVPAARLPGFLEQMYTASINVHTFNSLGRRTCLWLEQPRLRASVGTLPGRGGQPHEPCMNNNNLANWRGNSPHEAAGRGFECTSSTALGGRISKSSPTLDEVGDGRSRWTIAFGSFDSGNKSPAELEGLNMLTAGAARGDVIGMSCSLGFSSAGGSSLLGDCSWKTKRVLKAFHFAILLTSATAARRWSAAV